MRKLFSPAVCRTACVCLVLLLLLGVSALLPWNLTHGDISGLGLYTLSSSFKKQLRAVDTDVALYLYTEDGTPDGQIDAFLSLTASQSSRLTYRAVKAAGLPETADADSLTDDSVVITGNGKTVTVLYEDFFFYRNDELGDMSLETYYSYAETFAAAYGTAYSFSDYYPVTPYFNGEAKLANALCYITLQNALKILSPTDVSPLSLSEDLSLTLALYGYETVRDSLANALASCDILLLNGPTKDLGETETALVRSFLAEGGKLLLLGSYDIALPHILSLAADYGLSPVEGLVCEGNASYYVSGAPYTFAPQLLTAPFRTSSHTYSMPLIMGAGSIAIAETLPDGVNAEPFLVTTESAYRLTVVDGSTVSSDVAMQTVGAYAEKGESRFVWIANSTFFDATLNSSASGANADCGIALFEWFAPSDAAPSALSGTCLSASLTVSDAAKVFWSILLMVLLPLTLLTVGIADAVRRRQK